MEEPPDVIAPPPILFAAAWGAGAILHRVVPLALASHGAADRSRKILGAALVGVGVAMSVLVVRRFARASTPVSPLRPTRALVTDGPYRVSRNPDYLGQILIYAGTSIAANHAWPLLLLPLVVTLVTHGVVDREERYLARRFGVAYQRYREQVPRWL